MVYLPAAAGYSLRVLAKDALSLALEPNTLEPFMLTSFDCVWPTTTAQSVRAPLCARYEFEGGLEINVPATKFCGKTLSVTGVRPSGLHR